MQGWFTRVSWVFHFSLLHVTTYLEMTYHRIQRRKVKENTGRTKTKYKERKVKDAKIQIKKDKVCKLSTMLAVLVTILALHEP